MQKLGTPAVTYFGQPEQDVLRVEWTPVDDALYYYLYFGKETSEPNEAVVFAPMDFYEKAEGGVKLGVGTMTFTGDATVELKELPGGITDCKFIVTTSGPSGQSALVVEGSADGGATVSSRQFRLSGADKGCRTPLILTASGCSTPFVFKYSSAVTMEESVSLPWTLVERESLGRME